mmetsp:Transcript_7673/g.11670  ORF Transcript_7673/g.11670 Transcript_7673/m.11670 type:complete len:400 (-) Transcript_7673:254-1453(-)
MKSPSSVTSNQKDKKKKSTSLPASTVDYLKAWMMSPEHVAHPYPTEKEKAQIMADTGIELKQLTNWFVNNRKRYWKPRVEARLKQQVQAQNAAAVAALASHQRNGDASRVCFKVGLFPPQVKVDSPQGKFQTKTIRRPGQQPRISSLPQSLNSFQQVNTNSESARLNFGPHQIQGFNAADTYRNLTAQYFSPQPCTPNNENCDQNTQAVSMGSTSSFSDCDSSSHVSHDDSQEPIITLNEAFTPNNRGLVMNQTQGNSSQNGHTLIIGGDITRSISSDTQTVNSNTTPHQQPYQSECESKLQTPPDAEDKSPMKRVRSVSDFDSYSTPSKIIVRPRSLTLNATTPDDKQSLPPKRRFVEFNKSDLNVWQNACSKAMHGYDSSLPTLEEAALLFGFGKRD